MNYEIEESKLLTLRIKELKEICKKNNISGYSKKKKRRINNINKKY